MSDKIIAKQITSYKKNQNISVDYKKICRYQYIRQINNNLLKKYQAC